MPFRKVYPFLSAGFKTGHIPACVGVHFSGQISKLHIKSSLICMNIYREVHFQKVLVFFPVHIGFKINSCRISIEINLLLNHRIADLALQLQNCADRTFLFPFHTGQFCNFPGFLGVININIPVIVINRFILIHTEEISLFALLQHFPFAFLIKHRGEKTIFVHLYCIKRCFQTVTLASE